MDLITHLRTLLDEQGYPQQITEAELATVIYSLPQGRGSGAPDYADDRDDPFIVQHLLGPAERERLGLPTQRPAAPGRRIHLPGPDRVFHSRRADTFELTESAAGPRSLVDPSRRTRLADRRRARSSAPAPRLRVRIHAVVCRNDDSLLSDGTSGQSGEEVAGGIAQAIAETNKIFAQTGIEFIFYPAADLEIVTRTQLNQDMLIPDNQKAKLRQKMSQEDFDKFAKPFLTNAYRNGFAQQYPGKLVLYFAEGNRPFWGKLGQDNWRWCHKCQGLFFAGSNLGQCPTGGQHAQAGSGNYTVVTATPGWRDQHNWRWCKKCQGLFFAGNNLGECPAGGQHSSSGSSNYALIHNAPTAPGQDNWRWCKKCQGLFFAGNNLGKCPAGGQHASAGSGNYTLLHNEPEQWTVGTPSSFAFSGHDIDFVRLTPIVKAADAKGYAKLLAHEIGHFFHLAHTHDKSIKLAAADKKKSDLEKLDILKKQVQSRLLEQQAAGVPVQDVVDKAFDYDETHGPGVNDTAADVGPQLFHYLNLLDNGGDACGPLGQSQFIVGNNQKVTVQPDRDNVMSYFKGCMNVEHRFSPQQAQRMRETLLHGNRRRLVRVQLGDTVVPGLGYNGVWTAGNHAQYISWRKKLPQHHAEYDRLWGDGMRLLLQQCYLVNGEVYYDGVWIPGTHGQVVSWNKTAAEQNARYDELWGKGMRLIHQHALVSGGGVRYDGIWNPGTHGQVVSWKKTPEQHHALYDKLWGEGMRLIHQQGYVLNGQVYYDGIWNPGTHGQVVSWGKTLPAHNGTYAKMWGQGMRLIQQQTYVLNGTVYYDGIWNPSQGAQYVSWRKTWEQLIADYDEMWQQGMRLIYLDTYRDG